MTVRGRNSGRVNKKIGSIVLVSLSQKRWRIDGRGQFSIPGEEEEKDKEGKEEEVEDDDDTEAEDTEAEDAVADSSDLRNVGALMRGPTVPT